MNFLFLDDLNDLILKLRVNKFSDDELKELILDVFSYINEFGHNEDLIKNLIEAMVKFIINGLSIGDLTFDDYTVYVRQFKDLFREFSGFDVEKSDKYFSDYGLDDNNISFCLFLELLVCNDELERICEVAEVEGISVSEWLDNKIASLNVERDSVMRSNEPFFVSIRDELKRRMRLTGEYITSILLEISPEIDFETNRDYKISDVDTEYVKELEEELDFINSCSYMDDSELLTEFRKLDKVNNSSMLNSYKDYKLYRRKEIIYSELSKRMDKGLSKVLSDSNETSLKNDFGGISTRKVFSRLSTFMNSISRIDAEISKYKKKKTFFEKSKILQRVMVNFNSDTNKIQVNVSDDKKERKATEERVIKPYNVKIQRRTDLLYKSMAVIGGFGVGLAMASCPGVGLFRMTLSGIKLTSSLHNVIKKKFPESLFSRFGNYVKEKLEDRWNDFSEQHKHIFNFINKVNSRFGKLLSNDIVNYFINSLASGYFIGNMLQLFKMFGKFFDSFIDKFEDFDFNNVKTLFNKDESVGVDRMMNDGFVSDANRVSNDFMSNTSTRGNTFVTGDGSESVRRYKPLRVRPEVIIDNFSSAGDVAADSVSYIEECLFKIGDHIDASMIEFGYISSDSLDAVSLNTSVADEVIVDKIVKLANGQVRVHLKQLSGLGYAWVDNETINKIFNLAGRGR